MTGWMGDLRLALRSFVKNPALSLVMLLTLGVGIGASSAIFSIVDRVIVQRLPVPDADRLVYYAQDNPERGITDWNVSYAAFRRLTDDAITADFAAIFTTAFNVTGTDGPIRVNAARVSDSWFRVTGVPPVRGRAFTRREEAADEKVALLTHDFWVEQFGSEPGILGTSIDLGGTAYTIVGVMPPGTRFPDQLNRVGGVPGGRIALYLPLEPFGALQGDNVSVLRVLGRIRPGVTIDESRAEVQQLFDAFRGGPTAWSVTAARLQDHLVGSSGSALVILFGSVVMLLLMVCANLSGLFLVRGLGRAHEWTARLALGASRTRIVRQILTEGGVLALGGGALGLVVAQVAVSWVRATAPPGVPRIEELALDPRAILFALGVSALTAVLFALLPAQAAARRSGAEITWRRTTSMPRRGRRALGGLVALEVGLAVVLTVGSGVLLRSLSNLLAQDPGYVAAGVLRGSTSLPQTRYATDGNVRRFADQVRERLSATPGVRASALTAMPLPTTAPSITFQRDGSSGPDFTGAAMQNAVSPEYFDVMRIPLVEGRAFTDADDETSPPVAIVTRAFAASQWPGESAVGKSLLIGSWRRFLVSGASTTPELREIVGVVDDIWNVGLDPGDPVRMIFYPFRQDPWAQHAYVIRTEGSPASLAPVLREAVSDTDPNQPVFDVGVMLDDQRAAIGRELLSATVIAGFAAVSLLLAGLGVYGVVAYSVTLRKREIGVRIALGAEARSVMALFLRDGITPVLLGLTAGLGTAYWAVRLLRGLLYEISPTDPVAFLGAGVALGLVAFGSMLVPARRTGRVDPVETLRP